MSEPGAPARGEGPRSGSGQIVAAGSAGGSIYDLGYRGYRGPRLGRWHAVRSLGWQSFRSAWGLGRPARAKVIPMGLAAIALLPAVVVLGVTAIARQAGAGETLEEAVPISYANYYEFTGPLLALFTAAQAPELVGRDLRHRVLALLFTRAFRREDYAAAKLVALAAAIGLVLLVPEVIVFIGRAFAGADILASVRDDLPSVAPVLGQAALTAALLSSLGLAIAAFTPRRAYATAGIIAALIVPPIAVAVAVEVAGESVAGVLALLSPSDILMHSNAFFFDTPRIAMAGSSLPAWWFVVAGILMVVGCSAVLVWRYRRVEP